MFVISPVRRAPGALIVCRAVFANGVSVAALTALAVVVSGVLLDSEKVVALAPETAFAMGLWWGVPLGFVHAAAQLVAGSGARPEDPASTARNAATAVSAVPVVVLVLASAVDVYLLAAAGLALLHGAVVRWHAPRWVVWRSRA